MQSKIIIGILGCAHIHLNDYLGLIISEPIKVEAVWDHNEERAKIISQKLSCFQASSAEEIINNKKISVVLICSETDRHENLIIDSYKMGKRIFCEKPLSTSLYETSKILAKINLSDQLIHTGFFLRENAGLQELADIIKKDMLGHIIQLNIEFCHAGLQENWFADYKWMVDKKQAGFGGFGDLAIHLIDILLLLLGDIKRVISRISFDSKLNIDAHGKALLEFNNGCLASISAGWNQRGDMFSMILRGTKGYAVIIKDKLKIVIENSSDKLEKSFSFIPQSQDSLKYFLDSIKQKRKSKITKKQLYKVSLVIDKLYKSSRNKHWENIEI